MELRTLRYFLATADTGSVSAAAAVVHVSQPSLSRQLRQLEAQLSVELFVRGKGRLQLSSAGRQFLPVARELLVNADAVERAARGIAAGRLEHISITAPTTTLTDVIAPFLATFSPSDPVPTVVVSETSPEPHQLLKADLAILTTAPARPLEGLPLAALPIWAYVPADHRWASRGTLPLAELVEETLMVMEPQYRPREIVSRALDEDGLALGSVLECSNAQLAQALAAAGRGVAVVSDDPRFGLIPLRILSERGPLSIRLHAAWNPGHHAVAVLEELARRLRTFCGDRYGEDVLPP